MIRVPVKLGDRYGRLVILKELPGTPRRFECQCDCGNLTVKYLGNLRNKSIHRGPTLSCGCVRSEVTANRNRTHGLTGTPEYGVWGGIHKRCCDPKCKSFPDYGGRGITIAPEWSNFATFYADMGPRPTALHTIERRDTNGNYCKDNCCWVTRKEQNRNTRVTRLVLIAGEQRCVGEWDEVLSQRCGLKPGQFKTFFYGHGETKAIAHATELLIAAEGF